MQLPFYSFLSKESGRNESLIASGLKTIQEWWNDHDSGARAWTRVVFGGTTTNDNASLGQVGEYISSVVASGSSVSFPSTGNYGDLTSISLTPGDWDINAVVVVSNNGSTVTSALFGISQTSGNSGTGINGGDNAVQLPLPTVAFDVAGTIPEYRQSLSLTKTIYLKINASYSVAAPKAYGRISARRVR